MTLEKNFERRCTAYCKNRGWLWLKFGTGGWPDRLLVLPGGLHIWMELKTTSKVTPLQLKRIDTLRKQGAYAYVIESFDKFQSVAHTGERLVLSSRA